MFPHRHVGDIRAGPQKVTVTSRDSFTVPWDTSREGPAASGGFAVQVSSHAHVCACACLGVCVCVCVCVCVFVCVSQQVHRVRAGWAQVKLPVSFASEPISTSIEAPRFVESDGAKGHLARAAHAG